MEAKEKTNITVQATIYAPIDKVWAKWNNPEDIMKWNTASVDWHTTKSENNLQPGGKFLSRMEAKDGSFGFDFMGIYDEIKTNELISYTMEDGRKVQVIFTSTGAETKVIETFDAEGENSVEAQQGGWQAILDNFKKYVETK